MTYSFATTAEQEAALTMAGRPSNQTNDTVFSSIVTQALLLLVNTEAGVLINTIEQNNGLESLEEIASQPPNPNTQVKV